MSARVIDGRELARRMLERLRPRVAAFAQRRRRVPGLAMVSIGMDKASHVYVRKELEACRKIGLAAQLCAPPGRPSERAAIQWLLRLAKNPLLDAILVESPVAAPLDFGRIAGSLPGAKDAEGLSFENYASFYFAKTWREIEELRLPLPATAQAVMALLEETGVRPAGKHAVVVGRSRIVGRPVAHLLSARDATVTLCHSKTPDLGRHLRGADIVVAAVGKPGLIGGRDLKRGAVVIDAGINVIGGKIRGDVDFDSARRVAGWITPVPGGVGPVTTACLLSNVLLCAERAGASRR